MPHSNSSCAVNESIVSTKAATVTGTLILSLVFLLGLPGNLFVIWSILARARKQSVTTILILNLAIADGSLMALTPFFIVYLAMMEWKMGTVMCKVLFYLCLANMYASIQLIMLMSIYRLVSIVWPQRISVITSKRIITRVLAVIWVFVMVASIPALIYRDARRNKENKTVCDSFHDKDPDVSLDNPFFLFSSVDTYELSLIPPFFCPPVSQAVLQYMLEIVLGFVVPYGIILVSYICILRRIRQTKFRRRVRSEKLILAIVVTFCLFWLPYHVINMVQVGHVSSEHHMGVHF